MAHNALPTLLIVASMLVGCTPSLQPGTQSAPRPPVVQHRTNIPWLPTTVARFAAMIDDASFRHGVDANLLAIVVLVESGGNPHAVSPAGAVGLMQIMPATARDIVVRRGIRTHSDIRLYDPAYNLDLGAWYLARQLERFWTGDPDTSVDMAAAAYNGGPGRLARREPLPAETRSYRKWVGGMWRQRHVRHSPSFDAWWRAGGDRLVTRAHSPLPPPGAPPILAGPPHAPFGG